MSEPCARRLAERVARGREPGRSIAYDGRGVVFRGNRYRRVAVAFDEELDTVRFIDRRGRVPAGSRVAVPLFHGFGADYSHSGSMISTAFGVFAGPGPRGGRGGGAKRRRFSLARRLALDPGWRPAAVEAVDLPFHGGGPEDEGLRDLDGCLEWLARGLRQLVAFGLPVIPVCRSASGPLVLAAAARCPGMVTAVVLTGPPHPVTGFAECLRRDEADLARRGYVPNRAGRAWFIEIYRQLAGRWPPAAAVPSLVLVGADDPDTPPEARRAWCALVRAGGGEYAEVTSAGHDVLSARPDQTAAAVYSHIYQFIGRFVPPVEELS